MEKKGTTRRLSIKKIAVGFVTCLPVLGAFFISYQLVGMLAYASLRHMAAELSPLVHAAEFQQYAYAAVLRKHLYPELFLCLVILVSSLWMQRSWYLRKRQLKYLLNEPDQFMMVTIGSFIMVAQASVPKEPVVMRRRMYSYLQAYHAAFLVAFLIGTVFWAYGWWRFASIIPKELWFQF